MNRVLCFAGRSHHRERLSPVVNALRARGVECPYICTDNAIQLDPSSEYLIPAGEPFIDTLSVLESSNIQQVTEMTHLMLNSIYSQVVELAEDITTFIPPFWISYSVREFCELLVAVRKIYLKYKPDVVIGLHENNAFYRVFAYVCHEMGIPSVVFSEGILRHRDQKTQGKQSLACEYSTKLFVWSDNMRQAYIEAGISEEKVVTVGIPHMDYWFQAMKDPQWPLFKPSYKAQLGFNPDMPLVTFTLPILHRYEGSPMKAIGAVADWAANRFTQMAFSFHPFEGEENVKKVKDAIANHPYAKVVGGDVIPLLAASDLVLCQHSTVAVECMAVGTPMAQIDLDNVGILESLSEQGVAHEIREGQLNKILEILEGKHILNYAMIEGWINTNVGPRDGRAVERVLAELERL